MNAIHISGILYGNKIRKTFKSCEEGKNKVYFYKQILIYTNEDRETKL